MANISISRGNTLPDSASKSDFHNLIDQAIVSISNIANADLGAITAVNKVAGSSLYNLYSIISGASIPSHALADITQANKVSGQSLYNLTSIFSGASIPNEALSELINSNLVSGQSLYNLASIPSGAGLVPYNNIVSSLASGGLGIYDGSGNFVGADIDDIAKSLSNVVFSWSGIEIYSSGYAGAVSGTTLTETGTVGKYFYFGRAGQPYQTILNFKFKKIAGVDTVTIYARIWSSSSDGNKEAQLRVDIGGENNTVQSVASNSPSWVNSSDIDVSGLTNGNVYNGTVDLRNEFNDTSYWAYCSAVTLIAS